MPRGDHLHVAAILLCLTAYVPASATEDSLDETDVETTEAAASVSEESDHETARHRFDMGFQLVDTPKGDTYIGLFGYTWAFKPTMSFSWGVTLDRSDLRFTGEGGIVDEDHVGLGDSLLIYSYEPSARITASPWIPNSIGFGMTLLVPTGDASRFLGADMFVASPRAGWVYELKKHFVFLPAFSYSKSFAHGDFAVPLEDAAVEFGLVWVHRSNFWISYLPELVYDFELEDWLYNDSFSVGKMFGPRIGFSVGYGILEKTNPVALRHDYAWHLLFHYVLPRKGGS